MVTFLCFGWHVVKDTDAPKSPSWVANTEDSASVTRKSADYFSTRSKHYDHTSKFFRGLKVITKSNLLSWPIKQLLLCLYSLYAEEGARYEEKKIRSHRFLGIFNFFKALPAQQSDTAWQQTHLQTLTGTGQNEEEHLQIWAGSDGTFLSSLGFNRADIKWTSLLIAMQTLYSYILAND